MKNLADVMVAKATLKDNGYFVDNLWQVDDVKWEYDCDAETAQKILHKALTNEATLEQIWLSIRMVAEEEFNLETT